MPIVFDKNKDDKYKNSDIIYQISKPKFTLNDLVLSKKAIEEIETALIILNGNDNKLIKWGFEKTHSLQTKKIINLYGQSGTGKTMAAHAIANACGKKILHVNYADVESKYVGETPKNLIKYFDNAKNQDAIIFFDEADAVLSKRVTNMSTANDTSVNQTRSVMLILLNEFNSIVIFATNFIENYDNAFLRRISFHIKFDLPDQEARYLLWKKYIPSKMPCNLDYEYLSTISEGLSGADIENAVLQVALLAIKRNLDTVSISLFDTVVKNLQQIKKLNNYKSQQNIVV